MLGEGKWVLFGCFLSLFLKLCCGYVAMKQNMFDVIEIVLVMLFRDLKVLYIATAI